jgi:uncharacterized protein
LNKRKIINDPLYGFITIPNDLIYDIISHPYFQRLRRIRQLGLTEYVYPGALHTRFHHALGAMHLMAEALLSLRKKDVEISEEEYNGALIAILLHDIGHAPFSHALENELVLGSSHEQVTSVIMQALNVEFGGRLQIALDIFNGKYPRRFFVQLVASQLDIDRLDYLNRDSFFTGVVEGHIGSERIIKMLNVHNDELVIEEKGIYSIENFLSARRLMYWQVYLHKTTVAIETMLVQIIRRVRAIHHSITMPEDLKMFLVNDISPDTLQQQPQMLQAFCRIDDYDIIGAIKSWQHAADPILSRLCAMLLERRLFNIRLSEKAYSREIIENLHSQVKESFGLTDVEAKYFVVSGVKTNAAYIGGDQKINIYTKQHEMIDIANASDLPNIKAMRKIVKKYYLCWPKSIILHEL